MFHRGSLYLLLSVFLFLAGCSGPKKSISATFSPEKYSTLAILVEKTDYARTVEDAFVIGLMNKGYAVVSRNDVQQILGEIQFQGSGLTQSDRVRLGNMLNVRGIVMAHLTESQSYSGSYTVNNAAIDARLIDVETGSIQWVSTHSSGQLGDPNLLGGGDIHGTVQGVAERVIESFPDRFVKASARQ